MKKLLFLSLIILFFTECMEKEYQPVPPQLKIIVKNVSGEYINGATVKLYVDEDNFLADNEFIDYGLTDSTGTIVFTDLLETVYYFRIEKGEKNNLESNYFFKEPLKESERKVITTSIF